MKETKIEQLVLQYVARSNYKPVKARILAKNLEIPKDDQDEFKRFVKRLVRDGKLAYAENHKIKVGSGKSASSQANEVVGKFQRKPAGFGFVRPRARNLDRATAISTFPPDRPAVPPRVTRFASR